MQVDRSTYQIKVFTVHFNIEFLSKQYTKSTEIICPQPLEREETVAVFSVLSFNR